MKSEDLVYGKHNFNRYGIFLIFLAEIADTEEMYKMLNEFKMKSMN